MTNDNNWPNVSGHFYVIIITAERSIWKCTIYKLTIAVRRTKMQEHSAGRGNDEMRTTGDFASANIEAHRIEHGRCAGHRSEFGHFWRSEITEHRQKSSILVRETITLMLIFGVNIKLFWNCFVSVKNIRLKVCYISTMSCNCSMSMRQWPYFCWWLRRTNKLSNGSANILRTMKIVWNDWSYAVDRRYSFIRYEFVRAQDDFSIHCCRHPLCSAHGECLTNVLDRPTGTEIQNRCCTRTRNNYWIRCATQSAKSSLAHLQFICKPQSRSFFFFRYSPFFCFVFRTPFTVAQSKSEFNLRPVAG